MPAAARSGDGRIHRQEVEGAVVLTCEDQALPFVNFAIVRPWGGIADPVGRSGLAQLYFQLLLRGTDYRDRQRFGESLERLGSELHATVGIEAAALRGASLSRHLEATWRLIEEALTAPALAEAERVALVEEVVSGLHALRDDDGSTADWFLLPALHGDHPLGRDPRGDPRELRNIAASDLANVKQAGFGRPTFAFGGDISPQAAAELARPLAAHLRSKAPEPPPEPELAQGLCIWVVDKPDRSQAQIRLATLGPAGHDLDITPFWLGVWAFAGTFTSPFCHQVREERGWSYVAQGDFSRRRRLRSPLVFYTAPALEDAVSCLMLELDLFAQLCRGEVSDAVIAHGRDYLLGRYPFSVATAVDLVWPAVQCELLGLSPERVFDLPAALAALDPEQVRTALRRRLAAAPTVVTLLAPADKMVPELERRLPDAAIKVVDYRDGVGA